MSKEAKYPYEENAEACTVKGWKCRGCGRFHGSYKPGAQYCCAKDVPCNEPGCTNRCDRGWTACVECRRRHTRERYMKLEEVDWDGETPLTCFDNDVYFWNMDYLLDYLNDLPNDTEDGTDNTTLEDLMLVLCEPAKPSVFEMADFLSDDLHEDCDLPDTEEIDKQVNDWIESNLPAMWIADNKRVRPESLGIVKGSDGWNYVAT